MSASLLDNNRTKQMPNFLREADLDINKTDFKLGGEGGGEGEAGACNSRIAD